MGAHRRVTALALCLLVLAGTEVAAQTATGWRDSLRTRPRLGGGQYIDGAAARERAENAESEFSATSEFAEAPPLPFAQTRLQELLQLQALREGENARRTPIFSADSLLAVDLYQLRGEELPHYYPLSDIWVYIWRGRGRLARSAGTSVYGPGELLQIPAGELHAFANESGAPTVALVWQWPPIDDTLTVLREQSAADSLGAGRRWPAER